MRLFVVVWLTIGFGLAGVLTMTPVGQWVIQRATERNQRIFLYSLFGGLIFLWPVQLLLWTYQRTFRPNLFDNYEHFVRTSLVDDDKWQHPPRETQGDRYLDSVARMRGCTHRFTVTVDIGGPSRAVLVDKCRTCWALQMVQMDAAEAASPGMLTWFANGAPPPVVPVGHWVHSIRCLDCDIGLSMNPGDTGALLVRKEDDADGRHLFATEEANAFVTKHWPHRLEVDWREPPCPASSPSPSEPSSPT